jgi:ATP-dependent Clp protease ATP-binding subunit ClpB
MLPALRAQLAEEEGVYANKQERALSSAPQLVHDTVTDDDIADIVSAWSGVPVHKLLEGELQKLLRLEAELDKVSVSFFIHLPFVVNRLMCCAVFHIPR